MSIFNSLSNQSSTTELQKFIENKEWDVLHAKLDDFCGFKEVIQSNAEDQTLLLACKYKAPFDLIKRIVAIEPALLKAKETESIRTPLHLMCLDAGAKISISKDIAQSIIFLASVFVQATTTKDSEGMTPLHLLCMNACNASHVVSTIKELSTIGPAALTFENNKNETPMEVFLMSQTQSSDQWPTIDDVVYQDDAVTFLQKKTAEYRKGIKAIARREMYRLTCRMQDLFVRGAPCGAIAISATRGSGACGIGCANNSS